MGFSLYELNENIRQLLDMGLVVDDETGEVKFEASDLDMLIEARNEKIENIGLYIKNLKAEADAYKAEKLNIEHKQKIATKKAERLEEYLQAMLDGEKFNSSKLTVSYRSSESVEVSDITKIPTEYLRYKEPEVNKTDLKKALKDGKTIDGAELVTKSNMQIR